MTCKPKTLRLWQEISLALAFKAVAIFIIWFVWFSAPEDQAVDAQQVASHLFPRQPAKEPNHDSVYRAR
jgi:hypothetical protein